MATKAAAKTLALAAPGRFVLGLGVSSPRLVADVRGHVYEKPVPAMRAYLDAMEKALYRGPEPEHNAPIVLAALGPRMLALARDRSAGAFPYLVTPEHTRGARAILGTDRWLCVEQMAIAERDAGRRARGRTPRGRELSHRARVSRQPAAPRLHAPTRWTARATDWSTRWWPGATTRRSTAASTSTSRPAPTTSACRPCAAIARPGPDVELLERLAWRFKSAPPRVASMHDGSAPYPPPR